MLTRILVFVAALPLSGLAQTRPAPKVKAEPAGVLVVRDVGLGENSVGPFNQNEPGTQVAILLSAEGAGILSIEGRKSKVTMKDDKGTDLMTGKPRKEGSFGRSAGLWAFPKMAADGKSCVVEVMGPGLPAKGAKAVHVEGNVSLVLAQGQETFKQPDVKLEKGSKIKAGDLELQVEKAEKDTFDEKFPFEVGLSGGKGGRKLAKIRFFDSAGKEIESKPAGSSHMSGFGAESWNWEFRLKAPVQACTIEAVLWKDVVDVDVPLKLEVSLGL